MSRPRDNELHGIHVLIIEGDVDECLMLQGVLLFWGARVTVTWPATAGRGGLTADIVVCDLELAEAARSDFLRRLRRVAGDRPPPAIAIVPDTADSAERARNLGFARHVTRPVDGDDLAAVVLELHRSTSR